jgi:hypothetical protein
MLEQEKQQILHTLRTGSGALREAVAGIDDQLAIRKPEPGSWSILECVEHLAVSEQFLLSRLTSATQSDRSHENRMRETAIADRARDRTRPIASPEVGHPHNRYASLSEALSAFEAARAATIRFVEAFSGDPRSWITDHPMIPGPVTCCEILLLISIHPVRHAEQIANIRALLGPPDRQS